MKNFKKILAMGIGTALLLSSATATAAEFTDTEGHWAEETIEKWADKGVVSGYPDGTFKPDNHVTRAELIKILTEAFDLQETFTREYDYVDVDPDAWYYPYLDYTSEYMIYNGPPRVWSVTKPYCDTADNDEDRRYFLPDNDALRLHAALAIARIIIKQENLDIEYPEDVYEMQEYLHEKYNDAQFETVMVGAMSTKTPANVRREYEECWLVDKMGVLEGTPDGYMWPYGYLTRAGVLTMLDRIIE